MGALGSTIWYFSIFVVYLGLQKLHLVEAFLSPGLHTLSCVLTGGEYAVKQSTTVLYVGQEHQFVFVFSDNLIIQTTIHTGKSFHIFSLTHVFHCKNYTLKPSDPSSRDF